MLNSHMNPKNLFIAVVALAALLAAAVPSAAQQTTDLEREIQALKEGQAAILKELQELKTLLRAPAARRAPAGPNVKDQVFDLGGNPVRGDSSAELILVEFSDYQCPFCSRHVLNTMPLIEREYIETGKIRYTMLDLPLPQLHPLAFKAAVASHCAEDQGKFWEMHDRLFASQKSLEPWQTHAEVLGMDVDAYLGCLDSGRHDKAIRQDMTVAGKAGARGTPGFLIARIDPEDPNKVTGISALSGALPFSNFQTAIDSALGQIGPEDSDD